MGVCVSGPLVRMEKGVGSPGWGNPGAPIRRLRVCSLDTQGLRRCHWGPMGQWGGGRQGEAGRTLPA